MFSSVTVTALLLTLLPGLAWGNGDLDSNMNRVLNNYKIRGGAVAFFDKVSNDTANIIRRHVLDRQWSNGLA